MTVIVRKLGFGIVLTIGCILLHASFVQRSHADQKPPVTIDRLITHLGFDASSRKALLEGKILSTGMPEMEQLREELAVAAVMLVVKAPMDKVVAAYLDGESFRQNSDIIEYKLILATVLDGQEFGADFQPIGFTKKESSEVGKMIAFRGGSAFNFSREEIKRIRAINPKDPALLVKTSQLMRQLLMERYQSYFTYGLEALQPYDRGRGKLSKPGKELTVAVASSTLLSDHFPGFYQSLLKYPEPVGEGFENRFYWFKQRMDNRPMFQLSHVMTDIRNLYGIVAEMQFYVGHTYSASLTIIGCVPYEDGTVVFSTNRTFTDQVAGFGSSLKRSVGRGRIEDAISKHFAKLRSILEAETKK